MFVEWPPRLAILLLSCASLSLVDRFGLRMCEARKTCLRQLLIRQGELEIHQGKLLIRQGELEIRQGKLLIRQGEFF